MRTSPRTLITATALLALAAPLAACGSDDDGDEQGPPVVTDETPTADDGATADGPATDPGDGATADGPATDPGDGATAGDAPAGDLNGGVFPAIELAEAEAGGTAFEVDREDDGPGSWEVSVAVDGREIDVDVDLQGTEVLGTDSADDLDDDERAALDAATITLAEAIRTALDEVDGTLDDVELDEERDIVAWEVSIDDDIEVYVDVATGEVAHVDRD